MNRTCVFINDRDGNTLVHDRATGERLAILTPADRAYGHASDVQLIGCRGPHLLIVIRDALASLLWIIAPLAGLIIVAAVSLVIVNRYLPAPSTPAHVVDLPMPICEPAPADFVAWPTPKELFHATHR